MCWLDDEPDWAGWRDSVRFMGCGNHRDAILVYADETWHSGKGYYVYCEEYPEEGARELKVKYIPYYCKLPFEIYSNPDDISWSVLLESEYCRML